MYIRPNNFLDPTYKVIRPYDCSMLAVEGPNTKGKVDLIGLEIPYDSFFTSSMSLKAGEENKPILYGFLGNDVSFLMIRVKYGEDSNPRFGTPEQKLEQSPYTLKDEFGQTIETKESKEYYIEYYNSDSPSDVRPIGKLMILTGSSNNRIPQVYLNNPMDIEVKVEIMVASIEPIESSEGTSLSQAVIDGLFYNSILTDEVAGGATQFEIMNENDEVVLYLPLTHFDNDYNIHNIHQDNNILTITTENEQTAILKFVTDYDANQAHSRMSWILENPTGRYLTKNYPAPDLEAPVMYFNTYATDQFNTSGMTADLLRMYYLTGVTDNRDGVIDVNDVEIIIREEDTINTIDEITSEGIYNIVFRIKDIAGNQASAIRTATFDMTPPVITFKPAAQGGTLDLSIDNDSQAVPSQGLTKDDIIRFAIDDIQDNIDGDIANSAVTLEISGTTFPITVGGSIPISFSVTDSNSNEAVYSGKTLDVTDDIPPILTDGLIESTPTGITGDFESGYTFNIINDSGTTYELQFLSGVTKDKDLDYTMFPFYVTSANIPSGNLWDYYHWGYPSGTTKDYLEDVAQGNEPLFYIMRSGTTTIEENMYDGVEYNINGVFDDLHIRGDFPEGTYEITGTITDLDGNDNTITINMEVVHT